MSLYVHFINDSPVKIWGLSSRRRKLRVLRSVGVTDVVDDLTGLPDNSSALLLRADYLFDDRVIHYLVKTPDVLLKISQASTDTFVAAHVTTGQAPEAIDIIESYIGEL